MPDRVDLPQPLKLLIGTVIAGRYVVETCVGIGGMAAVFRGRHAVLDRAVAIKVLRPDYMEHPEVVARFDREARAASAFEHPNCIQVFDCGSTSGGLKFMVMPFLEGRELARILTRPIPPSQAIFLVRQILRGLEYAHRRGVVHRDLKPDNIFVVRDHEGHELLKIVDFGIAKLLADVAADGITTKVGAIVGTPAYMSPEQALGSEVDGRADLYAVGVMLFQMLTGRLPFAAADARGLLYQHVATAPPELPAHVLPELAAFVSRLLAKTADERFTGAAQALVEVEDLVAALSRDPTPWVELLDDDQGMGRPARQRTGQTLVSADSEASASAPPAYRTDRFGAVPSPAPVARPSAPSPTSTGAAAHAPLVGEHDAALDQMNQALQDFLEEEDEIPEDALRSGIFEAPPGGWDLDEPPPGPRRTSGSRAPTGPAAIVSTDPGHGLGEDSEEIELDLDDIIVESENRGMATAPKKG